MEITFDILRSACRYTGQGWRDSKNCNHDNYTYSGELEGYGEDSGYIICSDQLCDEKECPFLNISKY